MEQQELDSFSESLELYLKRLDERYGKLREIAADPLFLNAKHQSYDSVYAKFNATLNDIFELKGVWYEAKKLVEK